MESEHYLELYKPSKDPMIYIFMVIMFLMVAVLLFAIGAVAMSDEVAVCGWNGDLTDCYCSKNYGADYIGTGTRSRFTQPTCYNAKTNDTKPYIDRFI